MAPQAVQLLNVVVNIRLLIAEQLSPEHLGFLALGDLSKSPAVVVDMGDFIGMIPHMEQIGHITAHGRECLAHKLKIEGYTDATGYAGGSTGYGNWELSTERANAARRELLAQKISADRIAQIIGYGDSMPSIPEDPTSPLNRRISITVLPPLKEKGQPLSFDSMQSGVEQSTNAGNR